MQKLALTELSFILFIGLVNSSLIYIYSKDQSKESLIAVMRSLIQLTILGLILENIFLLNTWSSKFLAIVFILIVGAKTLQKRIASKMTKYWFLLFSMSLSIIPSVLIAYFLLEENYFSKPSFLIPYIGMLVGNSLTGINLGMKNFYEEIVKQKNEILTLMSFGASANEALSEYIKISLRTGLTPIVNTMLMVGLVSIPGLMTGQMMAGVNPLLSSRYQYFLIISIQSTVIMGIISYFYLLKLEIKKDLSFIYKMIGEESD